MSMPDQNQSLQPDRRAASFRPSDFGVWDVPWILAALAVLTGLAVATGWLADVLSHDLRVFLGGLALGWIVSACLSRWVAPRTGRMPGSPLSERVKELAGDPDRKIEAIRVYREESGASLAEAKSAVEWYVDSLKDKV